MEIKQNILDNVALGIITMVLFIGISVAFTALVIRIYIRKIKNYTRVIYQKDLDFQKTLTTTILETQEQVLNNISQDLHDDAGQQLTYINFMIENLKLDKPEMAGDLDPLGNSVYMLSNSIRRISHSLNSQMLVQQDLVKAIEGEAERLRQVSGMGVKYTADGKMLNNFNSSQQIVIFRIFQEITNNALKHSRASEINIDVKADPSFMLQVSDNGKGFDYEDVKEKPSGLGLFNLVSRAEMVGLSITIESAPQKGTTITLLKL